MKQTKLWIFLLAGLAALSIASIFILRQAGSENTVARIYQDSVCIQEIDLDKLTQATTIEVQGSNGSYNHLAAEHGRIRMTAASCPDQICVHQGWIDSGAIPIVCLPNGVIIQIEGGGGDLDAATG